MTTIKTTGTKRRDGIVTTSIQRYQVESTLIKCRSIVVGPVAAGKVRQQSFQSTLYDKVP